MYWQPCLLKQLCLLGLPCLLVLVFLATFEKLAGILQELALPLAHLDGVAPKGALSVQGEECSDAISWIVLRPLIASMATYRKRKPSARALNSGLWVWRLFIC